MRSRARVGGAAQAAGFRIAVEPCALEPPELHAISFRPLPESPSESSTSRRRDPSRPAEPPGSTAGAEATGEDPAELVWRTPGTERPTSAPSRRARGRLFGMLSLGAACCALAALALAPHTVTGAAPPRSARHGEVARPQPSGARVFRARPRALIRQSRYAPSARPRAGRTRQPRPSSAPQRRRPRRPSTGAVAQRVPAASSSPTGPPAPARPVVSRAPGRASTPAPTPHPPELEFGFEHTGSEP